ncbi:MAG: 50S ribosomal protein L24 [Candidatus Cloacimonetes bacterium]|nr:50S ribosomal protein L24 [Candidatus Cloacimonadota bacterium]
MKIRKGDNVKIISGKDRGKTGIVEKVFPRESKVLIAGINIVKKHVKKRSEREPGGILDLAAPISVSNVMLLCPKCGLPTRIGYQGAGKNKVRVCKKCGTEV